MTNRLSDYLYIVATIVLTVYGQLALKWRMDRSGELPDGFPAAFRHIFMLLFDPVVASTFFAAFLASLAWMAAMTRFQLSYAYPFTSLNFVLVLLISTSMLGETFTWSKAIGVTLIVVGTVVATALPQ